MTQIPIQTPKVFIKYYAFKSTSVYIYVKLSNYAKTSFVSIPCVCFLTNAKKKKFCDDDKHKSRMHR